MRGDILKGNIPVLFVEGSTLPEAWEKSLLALNENGCSIRTQYDWLEGPPSKDCSMTIVVSDPTSEPMLHRAIPGGFENLQEYALEITDGIKDQFLESATVEKNAARRKYTIHNRLYDYVIPGLNVSYDQIKIITQKLIETPHTRQAQATTCKVWEDHDDGGPTSLQSIWCRLLKGDNNIWYLNANIRSRSTDAYNTAFMDMFAIVQLIKKIAKDIETVSGSQVKLGRYVHQIDSYYIYGADFKAFNEVFLKTLFKKSFEERTASYSDMKPIMDKTTTQILEKIKRMSRYG